MHNLRLPSFFQTRTTMLAQWTVQLPDGTSIQHLLEMGLHIMICVWGYMSVTLLERHQICQLDPVLDQGCLAQVQVTAGK